VLRQGGAEEGPVDGGRGPEARQLHPQQRAVLLARRAEARRCVPQPFHLTVPCISFAKKKNMSLVFVCVFSMIVKLNRLRAAAVREELPAAVDQLPPAGPEEGPAVRRGGEARRRPPCSARQQVTYRAIPRAVPFFYRGIGLTIPFVVLLAG
jgi:hypothetical protein